MVDEFKRLGIDPKVKEIQSGGVFKNKKIVLTGTLNGLTRSQASKEIQENGGEIQNSVSKTTDVVIYGDKAGSKLSRAKELGIQTMDETQFMKFLKGEKNET